ncbi:hypothetical protein GCM10010232_51630 [Streptomyces amakusaensis]|uniref:Lipoprotein n=1 Tax=Streptomyces amakusaensis TaxID=67271 RepID=A0ABW0AKQ1_9ACTN
MSLKNTFRFTARRRLTTLAVVPVLAFSAACGGGGDDSSDGAKSHGVAEAPAAPSSSEPSKPAEAEKSKKSGASGKSAFYDTQMKYVQCMRAKGGYPDFPDPRLSGYLDWSKINEIGSQPGRNEGIKGGKNRACVDELMAAGSAEPRRDAQKDYESLLTYSKCMRDNGVSRFTNPVMTGGNVMPGGDPNPASPALDPGSPAYKKAEKACSPGLLEGLEGMA